MEVDTRAAISLISEKKFKSLFTNVKLTRSIRCCSRSAGVCLPVIGEFAVDVRYEAQQKNLVLKVVAGNGPCLLGRNWLEETKLNWKEIKPVSTRIPGSLQIINGRETYCFSVNLKRYYTLTEERRKNLEFKTLEV